MKRAVGMLVVAGLMGLAVASVAHAETIAAKVTLNTGIYSGANGGGEFTASGAFGTFQTFCLEFNEHYTPSGTYYATIDPWAIGGGVGGQDQTVSGTQHDTLDPKTAYLYKQFRDGTLSNYFSSASRTDSATALQLAIWYIEGELKDGGETDAQWHQYQGSTGIGKQAQAWVAEAGDKATTLGNVRVLNLWSRSTIDDVHDSIANATGTYRIQSQLILVPLPAAAATTLAGLGMLLAGAAIRRIRNRVA